jgi:hypothetical protein
MMLLLLPPSNHATAAHSAPKVIVPSYVNVCKNEGARATAETPQPPPTSSRQLQHTVAKQKSERAEE